MANRWIPLLLPWAFGFSQGAVSPAEAGDSRLLSLLNTPITVASHVPLSVRESPGIVTVIQREDILASGARDLLDVLRFVPGLDFASDTQGVVGIGVRTNWGHDGKVLLLFDGQEMNEPLYGTLQFGGHYPIDNILRIEIIRGPGSVVYGGYAELAVINVITRRGGNIGGVDGLFWAGGTSGASQATAHGSLTYGQAWDDTDLSLSYTRAASPQGTGPWPLPPSEGGQVRQAGTLSRVDQDFLSLKVAHGDLNLHYLRDAYVLSDYTGEVKPGATPLKFPSDLFGVDYQFVLGNWAIKPALSIKSQLPWLYTEARTDRNTRTTASVLGTWARSSVLKVALGLEGSQDNSSIFWSSRGTRQTYTYENRAGYGQLTWSPSWGNFDLGLRYDRNSAFGAATSPRLAFTKATEDWHVKVLAAGAFRAPSIENLLVNPGLVPERTSTYELEVGHAFGAASYLTANAYVLRIHNIISYANLGPGLNGYFNFDHAGSRGIELSIRTLGKDLTLQSSLSLSRSDDHDADFFRVDEAPAYHVGFANVKFTTQAQWQFLRGWSLNPGLIVWGPSYGYRLGDPQPSRFGTTALLNAYLARRVSNALEIGLNAVNLGHAASRYLQPYGIPGAGGNPPLPGEGREVSLRVAWHL